jgi:hypothetical protein
MKTILLFVMLLISSSAIAQSQAEKTHGPDCSGGWPTNMAFVHLKNAGLADNYSVDFSKTKTVRLASEKIGKDHKSHDLEEIGTDSRSSRFIRMDAILSFTLHRYGFQLSVI